MSASGPPTAGGWRPALSFYLSIALNFLLLVMSALSPDLPLLATVVRILGWPAVFLARCLGFWGPELPLVPFVILFSFGFYFALFWFFLYAVARIRGSASDPPSFSG